MIGSGEIHIWTIGLDRAGDESSWPSLSADERERAGRFRRPEDRRRYAVARGGLRAILGRYLGRQPGSLAFSYGPQGKPALPDAPLHFNLAHSHELAVLAIASEGPVGVDVEYIHRSRDAAAIVDRFFTERERAVFAALPGELRIEAFFRGWTGKEAYLKAIGKGLAGPLEGVGVEIDPREPACLREIPGDDPALWTLRDFRPGDDYRGAVLVAGPRRELRFRRAEDHADVAPMS